MTDKELTERLDSLRQLALERLEEIVRYGTYKEQIPAATAILEFCKEG